MNQFTHGNRTYLFLPLPPNAKHPIVTHNAMWHCIKLPQGDWKIGGIVKYQSQDIHDLIRSNGLYVENPHGDKSDLLQYEGKVNEWLEKARQWKQAQQKTVGNTLLIIKEDK